MRAHAIFTGAAALAAVLLAGCGDGAPTGLEAAAAADEGTMEGEVLADAAPSHCPRLLHKRTPEEVLEDHRAALAAGDYDLAVCNYAEDATVIADQGIDVGHEEIRASLEFFGTVFGGTQPEVAQEISVEVGGTHMVRLLFTVDTPCIVVPDGVDTYLIRRGLIRAQTSHAMPTFPCVP